MDKKEKKTKQKNKIDTEKNKTTFEKLKTAKKILKRRLERKYDRFRVKRIRQKKQRLKMKKQLSAPEYLQYLKSEFIAGEWKYLLGCLIMILLVLFLLMSVVRCISSAVKSIRLLIPETETELETETEETFPEKDITIGSTGCMLLHSPFIDSYPDEEGNYDFSSVYKFITPYYSAPDYMVCEFEGALGGDELGYSGYPSFKSPDIIIENIRDSGVDLQLLATNHIYDGWSYGFRRTMKVYEEKKIAYTGIRQTEQDKHYYIADINGIKVGFANYVYETTGEGTNLNGMTLEAEDGPLLNSFDYDDLDSFYSEMEDNIRRMRGEGAQFLIANMHWGNEYQLEESPQQREIAQKLCDLGFDALIGGHPHCEQPVDVFQSSGGSRNMFCIFSVGNALSNQRAYLMDEMPTGHTEDGVMVTLTLHQNTKGIVTLNGVDLLPTWVYRYQDDAGSKYYILPLDDTDNIESTTGIADIREEAAASYQRTMEELGPGLEKAKSIFESHSVPEAESSGTENTETESEIGAV